MATTAAEEKPPRTHRGILRLLNKWRMPILLGVVVLGAGYEWYNKSTYDKTVAAIKARLDKAPGRGQTQREPVELSAIEPLIYGIPSRHTGRERGNNVINLAWSGLATSYPLQLQLNENGGVIGAFEVPPAAIHDAPGPRDLANPVESSIARNTKVLGLPTASPNVVCLGTPIANQSQPTSDKNKNSHRERAGLLLRELPRQALLIAARDELGLTTRDPVLREIIPEEENATRWPLSTVIFTGTPHQPNQRPQLKVLELNPRSPTQLTVIPLKDSEVSSIEEMATRVEKLSRNEFAKVLTDKGYERQAFPAASKAEIPAEVREQLDKLNCLPQFSALRSLHAEIRKSGESPALLGGLARAYATLGTLCELHWSAAHKVFKARGLIYAERLVAKYPDPAAYRTRALVRVLVGLHGGALADLQTAAKDAPGADPDAERTAVLETFCRGNYSGLGADFRNQSARKLARYLQYLASELTTKPHAERPAAQRLLELEPDCLRVILPAMQFPDGWVSHEPFDEGREALGKSVLHDLPAVPSLPDPIRKLIKKPVDATAERALHVQLMKKLNESGGVATDEHEPSLGVAAELIRDMHFTQAWRDAAYLHRKDYVYNNPQDNEVTDLRKAVAPLLVGHPYAGFLDCFQWRYDHIQEALQNLLTSVSTGDVEAKMLPIFGMSRYYRAGNSFQTAQIEKRILERSDPVFRDFISSIPLIDELPDKTAAVQYAHQMYEVCPRTPLCLAYLVTKDWDHVSQNASKWEKELSDAPPLLHALAEQYYIPTTVERRRTLLPTNHCGSARPSGLQSAGRTVLSHWRE